jgi:hypothetical protein
MNKLLLLFSQKWKISKCLTPKKKKIYIYICVCIYIYTHTHTHIYTHARAHTQTHTHTHTRCLYCHCFKFLRASVRGLYSVPRADKTGFFICLHSTWFIAQNVSNLCTEPIIKNKLSKNYCSSKISFLWDTPHREETLTSWNSNVCYILTTLTFSRDTPRNPKRWETVTFWRSQEWFAGYCSS